MYTVTIWLFLAIPLVLGSWVSLLCFLHYPILMVVSIRGEEALLTAQLAGYAAYKQKVKYRLIPFIW
jgi:protein-S-isoprenylcysteine O-methyltransferase Ste14